MGVLDQLMQEMAELERMKTRQLTPTTNLMYGATGMFSVCASDTLINASVADDGIGAWLNWIPTVAEYREQGLITEVTQTGTQSSDACGDCPSPQYKGCEMVWCLGTLCRDAPTYDIRTTGMKQCDAYPRFRLFGQVGDFPSGSRIERDDEWGFVLAGEMLRDGLADMIWSGDPSNATGAGDAEFKGLLLLVNNNYRDHRTNNRCSAADSDVKDFNNQVICDANNINDLVDYVTMILRMIQFRAAAAKLPPINPEVEMAIVAPKTLLDAMYDCWPCTMQACTPASGSGIQIVVDTVQIRNEMRRARFLWVDGYRIPTLSDEHIPSTIAGTRFTSSVFVLTKSAGGVPLLWGEYQDFTATTRGARPMTNGTYQVTDGGRYLTYVNSDKWCFKESVTWRGRLVLLAPFLQGRIDNVVAKPLQFFPAPHHGAGQGPYDVGGGVPHGPQEYLYDECNP